MVLIVCVCEYEKAMYSEDELIYSWILCQRKMSCFFFLIKPSFAQYWCDNASSELYSILKKKWKKSEKSLHFIYIYIYIWCTNHLLKTSCFSIFFTFLFTCMCVYTFASVCMHIYIYLCVCVCVFIHIYKVK